MDLHGALRRIPKPSVEVRRAQPNYRDIGGVPLFPLSDNHTTMGTASLVFTEIPKDWILP